MAMLRIIQVFRYYLIADAAQHVVVDAKICLIKVVYINYKCNLTIIVSMVTSVSAEMNCNQILRLL